MRRARRSSSASTVRSCAGSRLLCARRSGAIERATGHVIGLLGLADHDEEARRARGASRCGRRRARAAACACGTRGSRLSAESDSPKRPWRTYSSASSIHGLPYHDGSAVVASSVDALGLVELEHRARGLGEVGQVDRGHAAARGVRVVDRALAGVVAGAVVAGLELDRAQRVERDHALRRPVRRKAQLGRQARLRVAAELHQRPGALGDHVGVVQLVVARR